VTTARASWPVRIVILLLAAVALAACGAASSGTEAPTVLPTAVGAAGSRTPPADVTPRPIELTEAQVRANLPNSQFHDRKHIDRGYDCPTCHRGALGADPGKVVCLTCHGPTYTALANRTRALSPNPHATHLGEEPCTTCHGMHWPFVYVCTSCHSEKVYSGRFTTAAP